MPVENSRQNQHGWWGTLTIDKKITGVELNERCVFVKTKSVAHYVLTGTFILEVKLIGDLDQAKKAFEKIPAAAQRLSFINVDLDKIASEYPGLPIVEIIEVDYVKTTPLMRKLNDYTRKLFTRDATLSSEDREWINKPENAGIGIDDILTGTGLP